ncbi:MAG: hypothetical protein HQQ74_04625 [Methanoculleus bourgensis]|uniref:Archaeal flagella protein FlaD/E domain-containing protein n=1 Tax=Methanoculleus bourgensis TaxID=83986 RepID=A0A8T7H2P3_9EURY|nr:hypothetical protein [Methanoculleus bourgensis]
MVGVDQAQIDKILAGVSSEDPEARLDALEKELDFVKTSIKRLLIDLRERMNELDNPFTSGTLAYSGARFRPQDTAPVDEETDDEMPTLETPPVALEPKPEMSIPEGLDSGLFPLDIGAACIPESGMAALPEIKAAGAQAKPTGKLKLQKVHRLFEWVHQGCRKYGHEHMMIMIDAYRSMGYITDEVSDQIGEIMRMVPETRRDVQEIGPNEFVSELYILNRILDPDDSTLDRDMIEVLMLSRRDGGESGGERTSLQEKKTGDAWIELLDRI